MKCWFSVHSNCVAEYRAIICLFVFIVIFFCRIAGLALAWFFRIFCVTYKVLSSLIVVDRNFGLISNS